MSIFKRLEQGIFWTEKITKIKYLHTLIILVLLLVIALLLTILIINKSTEFSVSNWIIDILKFGFMGIILGIILSITSNYLYDQIKSILDDPNRRAYNDSKILNFFFIESDKEKERRTLLTVDRLTGIKGQVNLIGIAATSYLPIRSDSTKFSGIFLKNLLEKKISLRLIILNPFSQAAKIRYARESSIDIDSIPEYKKNEFDYEQSPFYLDIRNTLRKVEELKKEGASIECKLTNFDPIISTMFTDNFMYVDVLSLGRRIDYTHHKKQRVTLPILEFYTDSPYYQTIKSHFEFHWKYGISHNEFINYEHVFKKKFYSFSYSGYKLVNQHESWISVDPVVGCNNGCKYCVLKTSFQNNVLSDLYTVPETIGDRLRENRLYYENEILSLFNYTDAFLLHNRDHLIRTLKNLNEKNFKNYICLITKTAFDVEFAEKIFDSYPKEKLIFLISISGLPKQYEPNINPQNLIRTMEMLKYQGVPVIHYWRPITKENSMKIAIEEMLKNINDYADISVIVGLKASKALNNIYLDEGIINKDDVKEFGDYLPQNFVENVSEIINKNNLKHSVYIHTSCAVSKIIGMPDYNGTMFRDVVCSLSKHGKSICDPIQERLCNEFKERYDIKFKDIKIYIHKYLPEAEFAIVNNNIEINSPIHQEDLIFLIHRINKPVFAKDIIYTNQYVGSIFGEHKS
ncbi:MAG: hypothetical protein ACFFDN_33750 [Candidatus Hodarchaeota archaeon]